MSNDYFEDFKNDPPKENGLNILAAAQELEMFAIEYCKSHNTTKKTQVIPQKWFGE